jgi:hypothetical protein
MSKSSLAAAEASMPEPDLQGLIQEEQQQEEAEEEQLLRQEQLLVLLLLQFHPLA